VGAADFIASGFILPWRNGFRPAVNAGGSNWGKQENDKGLVLEGAPTAAAESA
jgi:hypothetical protein